MQSAFIDRAKHARTCVMRMQQPANKDAAADYLRAVRGLPAEIRLIGLGQALATLRANDTQGCHQLYTDIEGWVMGRGIYQTGAAAPALLNAIIGPAPGAAADPKLQQNYRTALAETDAYLAVLKRLAEVFLDDKSAAQQPGGEQRTGSR